MKLTYVIPKLGANLIGIELNPIQLVERTKAAPAT